jgi:hypothetical protein
MQRNLIRRDARSGATEPIAVQISLKRAAILRMATICRYVRNAKSIFSRLRLSRHF